MDITIVQLQEIFRSALDEPVEISLDSNRDNLEARDSINHLNLIVELEDSLKVSFSKGEIENLYSVKQLIEILKRK
jgi:acyl carrier protein